MSSILKALKKLEDDRVAQRPEQLKIDADILKGDNVSRFSPSSIIIASLLLLAAGSGATYMFMKSDTAPEFSAFKTPPKSSGQSSLPAPPESGVKTEQLPEAVVVVPANQLKPIPVETAKRPQPSAATPAGVAAPVVATPAVSPKPVVTPKPVEQAIIKEQAAPSSPPVKVPPPLRVNGIAFEDGSAGSVAMVNGVPVTQGSLIEGAKVEEIHKNRVKFSYNGENFEIPLGQSNK